MTDREHVDDIWDLPFVHRLPDPLPTVLTDVQFRLEPDVQREVDEQLRAIDEARAAAMVSARNYVVWR